METQKAWVDFNLIKAAVTMEMLIVQYGVTGLARNGDELRGTCPIHRGKSKREFSVSLTKNTFICFAPTCKARGNVLDFVAKMEGCTVKEAALKLDEWFRVTEQEAGESEASPVDSPPVEVGHAPAALVAEIEAHLTSATSHSAQAQTKLASLKQLLSNR